MIGAVRTIEADVIETEDESTDGSRQCQAYVSVPDMPWEELRRWQDFAERCPNQAETLIWYSCPNGHDYPEEVCAGHTYSPDPQWCGSCANSGRSVPITITVMGRI